MTRWFGTLSLLFVSICSVKADHEYFDLVGTRLFHMIDIRRQGETSKDVSPPALIAAVKQSPNDFANLKIYERTNLCELDGQRAWFSVLTTRDGKNVIVLEYTGDSGSSWREAVASIVADHVKISFLDDQHGFLLATSAPSAGLMDKKVYGTSDGGRHWELLSKLGIPSCYPNSITFRNLTDGWIGADYHGGDPAPLYRTTDGGKTWRLQLFEIPTDYQGGYANVYAPLFSPTPMNGLLNVDLVRHAPPPDHEARITYSSDDGGATWKMPDTGEESTAGRSGIFHEITLKRPTSQ